MWSIAAATRAGQRARRTGRDRSARAERGQALVEFALVIPVFLVFVIGLIEFSFAFNAKLATNYASRAGGLAAAEAGSQGAADCLILNAIERSFTSPADAAQITRVDLQRTNPSGTTVYATSSYSRSGSTSCTRADGTTLTVPYSATTSGYPPSQRCNVLAPAGCPTLAPLRLNVDTIGVQITYAYSWHTPLQSVIAALGGSFASSGLTFVERNVFRMEPVL